MGKTQSETLVILDNTVLTNFGMVKRPELIRTLWPDAACTTQAVLAEYLAGVLAAGLYPSAWTDLPVIELTPVEEAFTLTLPHKLGAGERSCLAIAISRKAILATDDYDVRQYAQRCDLVVTGTVGILVRAFQKALLIPAEAQELLDTLIAAGYRSPVQQLDEFFNK